MYLFLTSAVIFLMVILEDPLNQAATWGLIISLVMMAIIVFIRGFIKEDRHA